VAGIDLTEEYCRTARELAAWVGLGDRVTYQLCPRREDKGRQRPAKAR
jgi:hypothetical protein